ncbi:MAG TPA: hypothetical protein DEB28_05335 [Hyphomonas sp.]|jgi:Flp pilus assembly protein TadG|nr:hypothetical protein [Hyphomonas sp.]HBN94547.1 hypothetical protein [Hyphomonas sp.]HBT37355.1 hypothetical protein [Hyphomonas sp.]HBU33544.1 hypothetical protein [Hyphomonas sp.]HBX97024.1 hypothetical protein [Hyphomonas sp.]|tara:strand:- start:5261 stop:6814 length:1554 start_codon:yes stop_codon:yes gene_type:complete
MGQVMDMYPADRQSHSLARDDRGNLTVLTAFILASMVALVGLAVDLEFIFRQQARVQYAMDSAVLAGALSRQAGATDEEVTADIREYMSPLIASAGGGMTCTPVTVVFTDDSEDILGKMNCTQPTFISNIMGNDDMSFNVASTSTFSVGKIDVSFVFDVSGSMNSNNRLTLLKEAAVIAFDELLPDDQVRDGTVRLGIVTYNNAVNAGAYFDEVTRAVTIPADTSNSNGLSNYNSYNSARMYDDATGKRFMYYENGTCTESDPDECDQHGDYDWDVARWFWEDSSATDTCVYERTGTYADSDAAPGSFAWIGAGNPRWNFYDSDRDKYRGENEIENGGANGSTGALDFYYATCRATGPVPLTEDKAALTAHVNSMTANGGTAGHLGVAWGWYLLSPNWQNVWPETAKPWDYDEVNVTKAVILMTDGDFNTNHPSASKNSFRQAMDLCDAMKAEPSKVQIYTVGFQVPSYVQTTSDGQTIMEYCATSPSYAFDASSGDELKEVYREIAQSISDLRIKS